MPLPLVSAFGSSQPRSSSTVVAPTTTTAAVAAVPIKAPASSFIDVYEHLCGLQNQPASAFVKSMIDPVSASLALNADKLKFVYLLLSNLDLSLTRLQGRSIGIRFLALSSSITTSQSSRSTRNTTSCWMVIPKVSDPVPPQLTSLIPDSESDADRTLRGYSRAGRKVPSIRFKERTNKLCRSLRDCLGVSVCLSHLELFNVPLVPKDCSQIARVL